MRLCLLCRKTPPTRQNWLVQCLLHNSKLLLQAISFQAGPHQARRGAALRFCYTTKQGEKRICGHNKRIYQRKPIALPCLEQERARCGPAFHLQLFRIMRMSLRWNVRVSSHSCLQNAKGLRNRHELFQCAHSGKKMMLTPCPYVPAPFPKKGFRYVLHNSEPSLICFHFPHTYQIKIQSVMTEWQAFLFLPISGQKNHPQIWFRLFLQVGHS